MPRAKRNVVNVGATIRQISPGKIVPFETVMREAAFRAGFEDVKAGRAPYEIQKTSTAWTYERGRLFACIWPSDEFKVGNRVMPEAVRAMVDAVKSRAIL